MPEEISPYSPIQPPPDSYPEKEQEIPDKFLKFFFENRGPNSSILSNKVSPLEKIPRKLKFRLAKTLHCQWSVFGMAKKTARVLKEINKTDCAPLLKRGLEFLYINGKLKHLESNTNKGKFPEVVGNLNDLFERLKGQDENEILELLFLLVADKNTEEIIVATKELSEAIEQNPKMIGSLFKQEGSEETPYAALQKSNQSEATHASQPTSPQEFPTFHIDSISSEKELGRGAFGKVSMVSCQEQNYVIKQPLKLNPDSVSEYLQEAQIHQSIPEHPNVVSFKGLAVDGENNFSGIMLEHCSEGSLEKYLDNPTLKPEEKYQIALDVANGMKHLAENKVVLRDLAARNVLLFRDDSGKLRAKVSDFGRAKKLEDGKTEGTSKEDTGPLIWMAPEELLSKTYSEKTDVWAFAVTLTELFTQGIPYKDLGFKRDDVARQVAQGKLQPEVNSGSDLKELLGKLTHRNPDKRISFAQIVQTLEKFNDKKFV